MVEFTCDGCGLKTEGQQSKYNSELVYVPRSWWSIYVKEEDKTKHACSRECIEKVNSVLPKPKSIKPE